MNRLTASTFFALVVFTDAAHAGFISDVFQPFSTDASVQQLLRPLFGGLVDAALGSGGEGETTVLTQVIKFLLVSIVVPFGGMLLLYSMYAGISASVLTGELFGDKKAFYWVVVRTVIGFGMITPAAGLKGLGLINLFLMYLTLSGVGAASTLWYVVVDQVTSKPIILASNSPDTAVFDAMLRGEICAAIYNDAVTEHGETPLPEEQLKKWAKLSNDSRQTMIGWKRDGVLNSGGCGRIIIDRSESIGIDSHIPKVGELGSVKAAKFAGDKVKAQMQSQTDDALNQLHTRAAEVAKMIIDYDNVVGAKPPPIASYFELMEWFKGKQQQAAKTIAESGMTEVSSAFKSTAKREGWATAGFYFLGLSTFQQAVNQAINMSWITAIPTDEGNVLNRIADETRHATASGQWQQMEGYINAGHQQVALGRSLPATVTDFDNPGSDAFAASGKWINDLVKDSIESNATPIAAAASLGTSLVDWGMGISGGIAAGTGVLAGAAAFVPVVGLPAAGYILKKGAGYAAKPLWLVAAGWALLVVSLLPALAWAIRILHWTIRVIVAQIAGPMWVILHVHHAGDGLEGNAGNGYRLALQLVLAPVLDITALAIVYMLMVVFTPFMNHTIMKAVLDMGSGSLTVVVVFVTVLANAWLVFELLALFGRIEHEVLAFVGGRGSDLSLDNEGSDRRRTMALMAFVNRRMPNFGGGKKDDTNNGGGKGGNNTTVSGGKHSFDKPPKVSNDKLLPKDK